MENPATWSEAERVVNDALRAWDDAMEVGITGLSSARYVTDALRKAGLLREETA